MILDVNDGFRKGKRSKALHKLHVFMTILMIICGIEFVDQVMKLANSVSESSFLCSRHASEEREQNIRMAFDWTLSRRQSGFRSIPQTWEQYLKQDKFGIRTWLVNEKKRKSHEFWRGNREGGKNRKKICRLTLVKKYGGKEKFIQY